MRKCLVLMILLMLLAQAAGVFWGSKSTGTYHYPDCAVARDIPPEDRITFDSEEDAAGAGYLPCKVCSPPWPDL